MSPADINYSRPQFSVPEHVIARIEAVLKQFAEFLFAQQLSKKSVTNYLSDVRVFLEHRLANNQAFQERAAEKDLKQWLSSLEQDITAYRAELLEEATPLSTINRYMASFRQFGAFLTAVHQISAFGHSSGEYLKNISFSPESHLHSLSDRLLQQFKLALTHRGCSDSTIKNYCADMHQYMQWLGEKPVFPDQIKRGVAEYLGFLRKKGASRATKARALTSLKQFYRWANESQYIKKNPFASKMAEVGTFVKTAFTPLAFFERFRKAPQQTPQEKVSEESSRRLSPITQAYDRYTRWPVSSYLHLAILILFVTLLGVFGYQQLFLNAEKKLAFPTALTRPNRTLSFQGRLTDSTGQTPITTATNFTFKLFDALTVGNQLWNSGTCSITPDQDGVFSTLLGSSCGAEIDSGVFSENPNVYLEVTVVAETLTPRQQIATVGYALNAETLQGYPASASAVENTVLIMNNSGQVLLGNASPVLRSNSGTFTVQGNALTLSTNTGTAGNISIAPDGVGQLNLLGGTTTQDFISVTNANLTTGKLINGTVGNNNTGYKFLSFTGGSVPSEKFYVGALGNVYAGNSIFAPVATISATNTSATPLIINGTGGQIFSIANSGNMTGAGTLTGLTGLTSSGTITFSGLNTAGAVVYTNGSGVLGDTAQGVSGYVLTSGGAGTPTWQDPATLTGANYWQLNSQVLAPGNTTLDLAVGGNSTAAALFRVSGTPTTSGNGAVLSSTTLTTGNLLSLSSTATSLTSGKLLSLDWSPGSAITATGDLFNINIGSNGTVGNLLNITDNGSSLFSVSETAVTSNLPTSFTSSGDVLIAYDLIFTNPTASYIKSSAPLYLQAGEMFNSSDLTLRTFNKGNVIIDSEVLVANYAATVASQLVVGTTTAPANIGGLYLTNATTYGKALAILNQTESQDIFTASASSVAKFTIANNGNLTATGTITGLTGITSSGTITFSGLNTAGAVAYTNGSGVLGVTAQGVSGYLLTSAGASTPTWTDPVTVGTNYWQLNNKVLAPGNTTYDLAIGGNSTAAAKFQVFGESGNATSTGTLTFNGAALANNVIAARRNVGLQIGDTYTGNIIIDSNNWLKLNTTNNQAITTGTGLITLAGNVDAINGLDVTTANLTVGGANFSVAPGTGNITTAGDLALNGGDLTSIATTFNFDIGNTGVLNFRDGTNTLFSITDGGTQGNASSSGNLTLGGQFQLGRFATAPTGLGTGALYYDTTSSNIFFYNGSTWTAVGSGSGASWWNQATGALYPLNSTVDMLIGGQATTSAKFAFINVNSGNPTASISGNLAIAAPAGADPATTYDVLNGGTYNLRTSVGGDLGLTSRLFITNGGNVGIGTVNPTSFKLQVAGDTGPNADASYDLGSTALQWKNIYLSGSLCFDMADCATSWATVGTNYWQLDNLVLSPGNSTLDIAVGGSATSSAKFQVFGVSGNATTTGTLTFNGATLANNVIAARRNVGLQIGGGTETGDILLDSNTFLRLNTINNQAITTGTGQMTLAGNVDAINGLDVTTANLTVGGANFSVAPATGNIITAGDLALNGGDLTSIATTFNFDIGNTGVLNFRDGTNTLFAINDYGTQGYATSSGDLGLGGQFQLGRFFTNPTTIGKGSLVYNTATDSVYYSDGSTWNQFASYAAATVWTDGGTYLYPTNRESARIYDAGGTDYIDIAHDGTNVVITTANTTKITIDAAVDLASTLNVGGNTITSPGDLSLNASGTKVIVSPDLQVNGGDILGASGETRITLVDALNLTNFSGSVDINGSYAGNDGFLTANRTATISSLIATDTPLTLRDNNAMNLLTVANSGLITVRTATISSQAVNSLDTVAFTLNAANSLTTQGAKLLSVQNATIEKFYVDKDGNIYAAGTILAGNGMGMLMQNKSGGTVAQKAIVIVDTSNNSAFTTTTTPYSKGMYGIITGVGLGTINDANSDGNCDANDICMVAVGGEVNVTIKNTTTVAKGDYVYTSDTAGSAVTSAKLFDGMLGVVTNTSTSGSGYVKFIFKPQTQVTAAASIDKGSKYNEYKLYADDYTGVGEGTSPNDNLNTKGMYFDNLLDTTKTDSANTTVSAPTQVSATTGNPTPAAPFRAGLIGGQTMSAATTDNAGNTYLGSSTVNKTVYYDRTRDSSAQVQVELGIDPNWYNGVTLAVATTSASFSQNSTIWTPNPNLSSTYNGSLLQASGTYASNAKTIYVTIKSPTTFDWTNYNGNSATGVTVTPGTSQSLAGTGVSVKFTDAKYNTGDVFKIASWFVEPSGSTRGTKQQFPERAIIVASNTNVDIIDADTQKLWMDFSSGGTWLTSNNLLAASGSNVVSSVSVLNGKMHAGLNANNQRLVKIDFSTDSGGSYQTTGWRDYLGNIAERNGGMGVSGLNGTVSIVNNNVNDVAANVIPNAPTQTTTVSGWGYFSLSSASETVNLPYKFNTNPNIVITSAGHSGTTTPVNLASCTTASAKTVVTDNTTTTSFTARESALDATNYQCYSWTATGQVSPRQFVGAATDAGVTVVNETDATAYSYSDATNDAYQNVALTSKGTLYGLNSTENQLEKWTSIPADTAARTNGTPDNVWANAGNDSFTKLLIHADGTNGATTFTDSSPNARTLTTNANAQISTAQKKFGPSSILLDGTGDYVSAADSEDWNIGNGDFTIDLWVNFSVLQNTMFVEQTTDVNNYLQLYWTTSNIIYMAIRNAGADNISFNGSWTPSTGTWYHVAFVRYGTRANIYINGISVATKTNISAGAANYTSALAVGCSPFNGCGYDLNGYMDEFRFTKGHARWTDNFTVPTNPYAKNVAIAPLPPTIQSSPSNLSVTEGTSAVDGTSDTLYIGTNQGVAVIQDKSTVSSRNDNGDEQSGSAKYYTKDYVSEELMGNVVGMWPLTSGYGSGLSDASSNQSGSALLNGTTAPTYTASGVRGQAATLGASAATATTSAGLVNQNINTIKTVSAWIYPTTLTTTNGTREMAVSADANSASVVSWGIGTKGDGTNANLTCFAGNTGPTATDLGTGIPAVVNTWYHVVLTSDGSSALKCFVNGTLYNSTTLSGTAQTPTRFQIGATQATTAFNALRGRVDEVMVTATQLSASQVKRIYEVGYRALQSHATTLGGGGADANQQLGYISTGTNTVGAVAPDYNNQFMYVGLNSTTLGGLSKIDLNSDTNIKTYNSSANVPTGGPLLIDEDTTSLAVGYTLEAVGSAASGVKTMGVDNNATATSGNFISKTYTTSESFSQAYIWSQYVTDSSDASNTVTVWASNDAGSNYYQCSNTNTNTGQSPTEYEYFCQFNTPGSSLKLKYVFARGSTKTNTYLTRYGVAWIGSDVVGGAPGGNGLYTNNGTAVANGSYLEVAHNQNTSDLLTEGWIYDGAKWIEIDDQAKTDHNTQDPTLLSWYKMEEASGDLDNAQGTAARDLIDLNGPTYQAAGRVNKAITLDGTNDYFCTGSGTTCASPSNFTTDTNRTLNTNLISYWKLDETSGSRTDSVGSNTLTDNNTVTSNPGKVGNAGQFIAANTEYLSITDNAALSTGDIDFTFSAWVYMDSLSTDTQVLGKWSASAGQYEYLLERGSANKFRFYVSSDGSTYTSVQAATFGAMSANTWYFVVAYHDSVNNTIGISVNNGAFDTVAHTTGVRDGTAQFDIGALAAGSFPFNGRIDEVGFWKKVLSTQEITDLYNSGNGNRFQGMNFIASDSFTLGGWFKHATIATNPDYMVAKTDGGTADDTNTKLLLHADGADTSTTFTDDSSSPHTMTAVGNAQIDTAQSKFGGASGLFDGTGDYVTSPDHADWDFASGDFTIDFRIRFNVVNTAYLVTHGASMAGGDGWFVRYNANNLEFAYNSTTITKAWTPSSATWYHVAVVRSGTNLYMFIDGTQIGTTGSISGTITDNANLLVVGERDSGPGAPLNGWLDEVRISKGSARWTANFTSPTLSYGTSGPGYKLLMESDGDLTFGIDDDSISFPEDSATSTVATYDDNAWHHVAAVKNGTTNIKLYVDGEEVASDTSISATETLANAGAFYLGIDGDATSNPWAGQLDETFVYSRALTAGEIGELYRSSKRFAIEQADANTVRLYNYSGAAQNLRLDVITGGLGRNAGTVSLHPDAADVDAQANGNAIWVNKTGDWGNLIKLQGDGLDKFGVDWQGHATVAGTLTIGSSSLKLSDFGSYSTIQSAGNLALQASSGNVGIGTLTPSKNLDVAGAIAFRNKFNYQQTITLTNGGGTLTNYDVLVQVDTASLISAGKMQSDCDDIRFSDSDSQTPLTYWIEQGCNTADTQIWARVPSIPNGSKDIYMVYGNSSVSSASQSWSGNFISMFNASVPAGWTQVSALDNKFPRGNTSYGGTEGADTHTVAISGTSSQSGGKVTWNSCANSVAYQYHTHTYSATSGSANNIPPYVNIVFGSKNAPGLIPTSGIVFYNSSLVSGWSNVTVLNTNFTRGSTTYGGTGGTSAAHNHTIPAMTTSGPSATVSTCQYDIGATSGGQTHSTSSTTTANNADTSLPPYEDFIPATPDQARAYEQGALVAFDATPPLGWTRKSSLDSGFPRGNSTAGGTGGGATHTHTYSIVTSAATNDTSGENAVGTGTSNDGHAHTLSGSPSGTNVPAYMDVLYYTKNTMSVTIGYSSEQVGSSSPIQILYDDTTTNLGVGQITPLWKLHVTDTQAATASAMIENLSGVGSNNPTALVLRLGSDATNPDTGDRFINFMRGDSTIIGKIQGNGSGGISYTTAGVDFAEYFRKEDPHEELLPGDVLCQGPSGGVTRCTASATGPMGVISNKAGFVGGSDHEGDPGYVIVGLIGQLPVKIDPASSAIAVGDFLTSSTKPGLAMKATRAGYVVAKALEAWQQCPGATAGSDISQNSGDSIGPSGLQNDTCDKPTIEAFVHLGYFAGELTADGFLNPDYVAQGAVSVSAQQVLADAIASPSGSIADIGQTAKDQFGGLSSANLDLFKALWANVQLLTSKLIKTEKLESPLAEIQHLDANIIHTATLSAQFIRSNATDSALTLRLDPDIFTILGTQPDTATPSTLMSIDARGNATFTGQLTTDTFTAQSARVQTLEAVNASLGDATIAGTLRAGNIEANTISGLDDRVSLAVRTAVDTATASGYFASASLPQDLSTLIATLLPANNLDIETVLTQLNTQTNKNITLAEVLAPKAIIASDFLSVQGLADFSYAQFATGLSVHNSLALTGNSISIDPLQNDTLYIQPSGNGTLNFLAGVLTIDSIGGVSVNGDLYVSGSIYTNTIRTTSLSLGASPFATDSATPNTLSGFGKLLALYDETGNVVGSVDASGSATFHQLTTGQLVIASPFTTTSSGQLAGISTSNASAGTAVLPAGQTELIIANTTLDDRTLVYLTPQSDTRNQVLYVKTKISGEGFTVAVLQPVPQDITFTYWLIKTQ